jgi:hypothetical protein
MHRRQWHDDESIGWVGDLLARREAGAAVWIDPRTVALPERQAMRAEHRLHLTAGLRTHEHRAAGRRRRPAASAAIRARGAVAQRAHPVFALPPDTLPFGRHAAPDDFLGRVARAASTDRLTATTP